ncbi:CocE/NonD family hydrolase [Ponticaulis koreensis]|uniref:CocE/NonD family hydrolase n=1 Tax=Ponticaulis koreensis TaxID=1123045 RepID=UPI0003F5AF90|nr:CocE/NonD family hydrolase [Ponticaulis koreensis]
MKRSLKGLLSATCLISMATIGACSHVTPPDENLISAPGQYSGYSEPVYDGYERSSFYVPVRDGTRLAVDLFRPTQDGELSNEPLPVVWMHSPYNRRSFRGAPAVEAYPGYAIELVPHGYNVAIVDFRGVFASFGRNIGYNRGEWVEAARWDAYDITEWFADQSYSNGNIGMWGCSATGGSQMQALTTRPPSLRAIIPMSAELDAYAFAANGGIARERPIAPPGTNPGRDMVARRDAMAVPVNGPDATALLNEAIAEHAGNIDSVGQVPFRDSISQATGLEWWSVSSPHTYLDDMRQTETGVLSVANWDEAGTRHGPFFTFNNLDPDNTKLLVGPATHCDWSTVEAETGLDLVVEELRFFDYWLKGIENNVMEEPAVTYYTYNAADGSEWRQSDVWPLETEVRTSLHLSPNETLMRDQPEAENAIQGIFSAPPGSETVSLSVPDEGLVFQTEPLESDTEVTGHPVVNLWIESDQPDTDVTAFLLDVAPDGTTQTFQMLGRLRASHRATTEPPYNHLGLPWHSFTSDDAAPLTPGVPAELRFDMLPMSYTFQRGHRIRLLLNFAAIGRAQDTEGQIRVLTGGETSSHIELPIISINGD